MDRLRRRAEFLSAAKGARAHAKGFVLQALYREDDGPARFGFTVSRKVGTAVERNRARRRLKEVVRRFEAGAVNPGYDYVMVARREAIYEPFASLTAEFKRAIQRLARERGRGLRRSAEAATGMAPQPNSAASPAGAREDD
jgi:ribonuclease P protein component